MIKLFIWWALIACTIVSSWNSSYMRMYRQNIEFQVKKEHRELELTGTLYRLYHLNNTDCKSVLKDNDIMESWLLIEVELKQEWKDCNWYLPAY